jgi:hypothetical protein
MLIVRQTMELGNTIVVKKISEWNRINNVKTKDIFGDLYTTVKAIANLEFGDALESGVKTLWGIGNKENDSNERRAYVLVYGGMRRAMNKLVMENEGLFKRHTGHLNDAKAFEEGWEEGFEKALAEKELAIDFRFFGYAHESVFIELMKPHFEQWMVKHNIPKADAQHITARLRVEFVNKLEEVWREDENYFKPLLSALEVRFQSSRSKGRYMYNQSLIAQWSAPIFDETFGLDALYVSLNACYPLPKEEGSKNQRHRVLEAESHIWNWLENTDPKFRTLVIRGGPGSGKSSLMKRIAMRLSTADKRPVYCIHLHRFAY